MHFHFKMSLRGFPSGFRNLSLSSGRMARSLRRDDRAGVHRKEIA